MYFLLLVLFVGLDVYVFVTAKSLIFPAAAWFLSLGFLYIIHRKLVQRREVEVRQQATELKVKYGADVVIDSAYKGLAKETVFNQILGLLGLSWLIHLFVGRSVELLIAKINESGKSPEQIAAEKQIREGLLHLRSERSSFEAVSAVLFIVGVVEILLAYLS